MHKFIILICLLPIFSCKTSNQENSTAKADANSTASTVKAADVVAILQQSISKAGGRLYPRSGSIEFAPEGLEVKKCYLALDGDALFMRCVRNDGPIDTLFCYLDNLKIEGQVKVKGSLAGIDCTVLMTKKPEKNGPIQDVGTRHTSFIVNMDTKSLLQMSSQRKQMDERAYNTTIFLSWVDDQATGVLDNLDPFL